MINVLINYPLIDGARYAKLPALPRIGDYIQYVDTDINYLDFDLELHTHEARVTKVLFIVGVEGLNHGGDSTKIVITLELP